MKAGELRRILKKYDDNLIVNFQRRNEDSYTVDYIEYDDDENLTLVSDNECCNGDLTVKEIINEIGNGKEERNTEVYFVNIDYNDDNGKDYYYIHNYHILTDNDELYIGISYVQ